MNAKNASGQHNPLSHLSPKVMWLPPSHVLKGISSLEAIDGLCPQEVQACLQKILQDWQQRLPDERKNSTGNTVTRRSEYYQLFLGTLFAKSDEVQKGVLKVLWCLLQEPQIIQARSVTRIESLNIAYKKLHAKNIELFLEQETNISKTTLLQSRIFSPMHFRDVVADIRCMWLQYALPIFGKDQELMTIAKGLSLSENPYYVQKIIHSKFGGDPKTYVAALVNTDVPEGMVVPKNLQDVLVLHRKAPVATDSEGILLEGALPLKSAAAQRRPSSTVANAEHVSHRNLYLHLDSEPKPTGGMLSGPPDCPGRCSWEEARDRAIATLGKNKGRGIR